MSLESATYINGLVTANPLGSDPLSDADGHLRLLKATIKATFPNITGPVTATQAQLNSPFPPGGIVLWSGSIASIPTGWLLCNGASGTPDLRDRFVVGAGSGYGVGAAGGAATITLTTANLPWHNHGGGGLTGNQNATHGHSGATDAQGEHVHSFTGVTYTSGYVLANTNSAGYVVVGSNTASAGAHNHNVSTGIENANHAHSYSIPGEGGNAAFENRPPFYALAYIMKI